MPKHEACFELMISACVKRALVLTVKARRLFSGLDVPAGNHAVALFCLPHPRKGCSLAAPASRLGTLHLLCVGCLCCDPMVMFFFFVIQLNKTVTCPPPSHPKQLLPAEI